MCISACCRHSRRISRTAAILVVVLTLVPACSGGREDEPSSPPSAAAPTTETEPTAPGDRPDPGAPQRGCVASVELTGAVDSSWEGRAAVRLRAEADSGGGPDAVYVARNDGQELSIYSAGEGFERAITYTSRSRTFAADPSDLSESDIRGSGAGAVVEALLRDLQGAEASLVASFDCSKRRR